MASGEQTLKFIDVGDSKDKHLRQAADYAKKHELDFIWISANDLQNDDLDVEHSVFVLDPFEGEHFDFLKEKECRIVGPQCVISCLETETPLPFARLHPVYTVAMRGVYACCTGVPKSERNELYKLIQLMGGEVMKDFTHAVTHLVAGEVGSQKYKVAHNLNKPVVLPSWVYNCWKIGKEKHVCSTDEELRSFACPLFKGFTISVTGLGNEERKDAKRIITDNGGTYSGDLNVNTCTHLIVNLPKGEKYEYARKWKLHCVSMQWLYDSVNVGYSLDEISFYTLPEDGHYCSHVGSHLSFSPILNSTTFTGNSKDQSRISKKATQAAYKSARILGDGDLIVSANGKRKQTLDSSRIASTNISKDRSVSALEDQDYNVDVESGKMFLDGCKIYLSNFNDFQMEKLRKIINRGGGTRFNQINETVSHIVVGDVTGLDLNVLINCDFQPVVVTVSWILDSAKAGKRLPEDEYLCPQFMSSPSSCKENKTPDAKQPQKPVSQQNATNNCKQVKANDQYDGLDDDGLDDDDDDVFQQYMDFSHVDDDLAADLTNFITKRTANEPEGIGHKDAQEMHDEAMATHTADPDVTFDKELPDEDDRLLTGKLFCIDGFAQDVIKHLVELIENHGGFIVHSSQAVPDFAIVPMNKQPSEGTNAKQMVTFCWLERSLQQEKLHEPTENFLFQPFCIPEGCQPLANCVLSISQYTGVERDHLYQLAELLGATCQEHFVRKATSKHQLSTHLLCQEPTGQKYTTALKWKIPVVSDQWLFACAMTGQNVDTKEYPLGKDQDKPDKSCNEALERLTTSESRVGECNSDAPGRDESSNRVCMEIPTEGQECTRSCQEISDQVQAVGDVDKPLEYPPVDLMFGKKSFRPSFDTADAMASLASPATPGLHRRRKSRASRNSFALDDFFVENIQQAIKNTENLGRVQIPAQVTASKHETISSEKDGSVQTKSILNGTIVAVSKKLNHQQTELYTLASSLGADYRWLYDESCTHLIHQGHINDKTKEVTQARVCGIHVVSPHWLYACQEEGKRVDEALYLHNYNPNLSLSVVTSGRRLTRSSKANLAHETSSKQLATTQRFQNKNEEEEKQVDKSNKVTTVTAEKQTGLATPVNDDNRANAENSKEMERLESLEAQLEAIMVATKGKGRRRSRRPMSSSSTDAAYSSPGTTGGGDHVLRTKRTSARIKSRASATRSNGQSTSGRGSRIKSRLLDESEQSQSDTITYDDPAGRLEREKIMAQLKKGCSPSPEFDSEQDVGDEDNEKEPAADKSSMNDTTASHTTIKSNDHSDNITATTPNLSVNTDKPEKCSPISSSTPAAAPVALQVREAFKPAPVNLLEEFPPKPSQTRAKTPPKCHLSVMTPQEKIDYSAAIEELGGTVFDSVYFNPACSHVIIGKPNRNEKYLAAMAAGKWVLRRSYVEASREAGHFVDEEPHEWGTEIPGEPVTRLAGAARRWRLKLLEDNRASEELAEDAVSVGAFKGWSVILYLDTSKIPGFKRLLEAGGAKVTVGRSPINNTAGVTHAFLDTPKIKMSVSDIESMQTAGIHLLRLDYIAEYLVQNPPPHPRRYLVTEVSKTLQGNTGGQEGVTEQKKRKAGELAAEAEKRTRVN